MPVARDTIHKVVEYRIKKAPPEPYPATRFAQSQGAAQSPKHEHGRSQEQRILSRAHPPGLRVLGRTGPEVDESFQAQFGESSVVGSNVVEGLALAHGDVRQLSHGLKLPHRVDIVRRVQIEHQRSVGAVAVSKTKLGAEIVADENELTECLVVAAQPGRNAREEHDRSQHNASEGLLAASRAPVPCPQARSREK